MLFAMLVGSESHVRAERSASADTADTPWDEPSENAIEFRAYVTGELWQYDPWCRIRGQAKSTLHTSCG